MADKIKATFDGLTESISELVKMVPGLNILLGGIKAYQNSIEDQQREIFLTELLKKMENLSEDKLNKDWYSTENGQNITKKIIAIALNAEYADKVSFFANALINSSHPNYEDFEKLKFIETLKLISKPALKVLAKERELQNKRGQFHASQVNEDELKKSLHLSPYLVETCVTELYNLGVFSYTLEFGKDKNQLKNYERGIPAYTKFSEKFICFIEEPNFLNDCT